MKIHTSKSLKAQDDSTAENYHYQLEDGEQYQLTEGELEWLEFVRGRYSIYDHIVENLSDDNIYTMDSWSLAEALEEDNAGTTKAVCLSDETALQAIFFYSAAI